MKKRLIPLLLALALLLGLGVCAHAEARLDFVTDGAGMLTETQRQSLRDRAAAVSAQYDCGVYIVVVNDYRDYISGGNIETFAEEVFHSYSLGYGETEDGVLLAMSMKERDYDIYAHGDFGNYAFTDYAKTQLAESFLDNFRRNDWAGGFQDYVETSAELMRRAKAGDPVDIWIPDQTPEQSTGFDSFKLLVSLVVGVFTGGVTVGGMRRQMKTAVRQTRAEDYIARGGVKLYTKSDDFINRSVSHRVIRSESADHRGGGHYGGTSISGSHGGSHHSGKF